MKTVLIKPIITEKSLLLASQGTYSFMVNNHSSKQAIAQAIEDQFNVHVVSIHTMKGKSEMRRTGKKRLPGAASLWKKARVTLKDKEKIDLFAVEQPPAKK